MLAEAQAIFLFHKHHGFHMEWLWNGHGMINSMEIPFEFPETTLFDYQNGSIVNN